MGLALLILSLFSTASAPAAASPAGRPERVTVGIFVLDLYDLDVRNNSFRADFFLWFRWRGRIDPDKFEFRNSGDADRVRTDSRVVNGIHYAAYRCHGQFHVAFDLNDYPLDAHRLTIEVEDQTREVHELQYVADALNSRLDGRVRLGGWTLGTPRASVQPVLHLTNYGIPLRRPEEGTVYSRFVMAIPIKHTGLRVFLKNFLSLFISVAIAFLAVLIRPVDLQSRLGAGLAGLFGVVTSMVVVSQNLPEATYFTLVDRLHVASLFCVFLTVLQSCLMNRFWLAGQDVAVRRIDRTLGWLLPTSFAMLVAGFSLAG